MSQPGTHAAVDHEGNAINTTREEEQLVGNEPCKGISSKVRGTQDQFSSPSASLGNAEQPLSPETGLMRFMLNTVSLVPYHYDVCHLATKLSDEHSETLPNHSHTGSKKEYR